MTRLTAVLFFVAMTFLCWGTYGPTLHNGQNLMDHSRWRPFICVGMAYFIIAVIAPLIMMRRNDGEQGRWTLSGTVWSFGAGIITAIGALGIILAFNFGGKPVYVMPLVFGGSPVVNTLVTMLMNGTHKRVRWPFYVAILLVALGAAGVFIFKPKPAKPVAAQTTQIIESTNVLLAQADAEANEEEKEEKEKDTATDSADDTEGSEDKVAAGESDDHKSENEDTSLFKVMISVLTTVVCWGSYGPLLHRGQVKMENSRLRPFICVGLAYFAIAVIVPAYILMQHGETGHWDFVGTLWSLFAGALGAFGSLGIILAFTNGGKPVYVMPIVFGMAPVINTATSMTQSYWRTGNTGTIDTRFVISLCLVIIGAVCVILFAPKGKPKPPADPVTDDAPADDEPSDDATDSDDKSTSDDE